MEVSQTYDENNNTKRMGRKRNTVVLLEIKTKNAPRMNWLKVTQKSDEIIYDLFQNIDVI